MKTRKTFSIRSKQQELIRQQYQLTAESKKIFAEGFPGQGFLGLLDLETGIIHLTPSFHHNDGMRRPDSHFIETKSTRGSKAILGPLMRAAHHHQLTGDDLQRVIDGKLIGFGIWKQGKPLRIIDEKNERSPKNYVPHEYILEKGFRHHITEWKLYNVVDDQHKTLASINSIKGLREAIAKYEIDRNRETLDRLFSKLPYDAANSKIKFVKFSSSSINSNAFEHDDLYLWSFFVNHSSHLDHGIDVKREAPFNVSAGILRTLNQELDLQIPCLSTNNAIDILNTDIVPAITVGHWRYQLYWDRLREEERQYELMQNLQTLFDLEKIAVKGHVRYLSRLWENRDNNDFFERCKRVPLLIFIAAFASEKEDAKKYFSEHYHSMFHRYGLLLLQLAEGFKRPGIIKIIEPITPSHEDLISLVKRNYIETIKALLSQKNRCININFEDNKHLSLLMQVIRDNNIEMMNVLIAYDKSIILFETNAYNPLEVAILSRHNNCLKVLLENGANPNKVNHDGEPPIHTAALMENNVEAVDILYATGANIDAKNKNQYTLLMIAAKTNNITLAHYLLDHGADLTLTNSENKDAFDLANNDEMKDLIIEKMQRNLLEIDKRVKKYQATKNTVKPLLFDK